MPPGLPRLFSSSIMATPPPSSASFSISSLPLPPSSQRLQNLLSPVPSLQPSFTQTLKTNPSSQRRATQFKTGHYSNCTPLPIPFPFRLPSKLNDEGVRVASMGVEEWLTNMEPLQHSLSASEPSSDNDVDLKIHTSESRNWPVTLLAISPSCLKEVLPHLNVGDALDLVWKPLPEEGEEEATCNAARDELVGVLGGREVVMDLGVNGGGKAGYKPWALRYGGRQFGSWAGQLGDGRAVSLLETLPLNSQQSQEIQIKGAGRTPFSRHADGLAVLRSSIREFLAAENSSSFPSSSLPTSRSLTLTLLPTLPVLRENGPEPGAIVSRIAPSFLRIGSFEVLNPPANEYSFAFGLSGGYEAVKKPDPEWEALRSLVGVVKGKLWGWERDGEEKGVFEMIREVGRRNAVMVAGWQAWGFMHGVINTDNVSVEGLTIDYGPYAYMDVFDPLHICNHSDDTGRYRYSAQPAMVYFAISSLLESLSEMVGCEIAHEGKLAPEGWAKDVSEETLKEWRELGLEREKELEKEFMETTAVRYRELMGNRLGLTDITSSDMSTLVSPLLNLLSALELDFHSTFRTLALATSSTLSSSLPPSSSTTLNSDLLDKLLSNTPACSLNSRTDFGAWLKIYAARLEQEEGGVDGTSEKRKAWNPRFVLRQWVLEDIIKKVEGREEGCREGLNKILKMSLSPFEPWGKEGQESEEGLSEEEREERRLCGLGEERMLGFQCSCSS